MGTFSEVYFNCSEFEIVEKELRNHLKIGESKYSTEYFENFWADKTLRLSKNLNENWVKIDLENQIWGKIYRFDNAFRGIAKALDSRAIFCYYQSTSCIGRFAIFEKGKLILSIAQDEVPINDENELRLIDNIGVTEDLKTKFHIPDNLKDLYHQLDVDEFYSFFEYFGLVHDGKEKEEKYLYLELDQ